MVLTVQATIFLAFSRVLNGLSHPIFYGAYCSSHHVISLSRVLTVWATLFSMVLTVQATIFLAFSRVLNCLSHPIFYGAYCSSHHVISLSRALTVWDTLFCTVLTVQATVLLIVMWTTPLFLWCSLLEPLWYSFPQGPSMFGALQYYLFRGRYIIRSSS